MTASHTPLHRHQLAYLSEAGWAQILDRAFDSVDLDCIHMWAQHRLPLVVTRQIASRRAGEISLGLPTPLAWERRRIAITLPRQHIAWVDEFPPAAQICQLLPHAARHALQALLAQLEELGAATHAYGSYGWQFLTGHAYVHESSDLDLWVSAKSAEHADSVAACLVDISMAPVRLDGELVFRDGRATTWREWTAWRAGRTRSLLVKRVDGLAIEHAWATSESTVARAT